MMGQVFFLEYSFFITVMIIIIFLFLLFLILFINIHTYILIIFLAISIPYSLFAVSHFSNSIYIYQNTAECHL